jgi:hypothetical protein
MLKSPGARYGVLGAIAITLYLIGAYNVNPQFFVRSLPIYWGPLLLIFAPLMYKALNEKPDSEPDFREEVRTPFLCFVLINIAYWLVQYGLHLYDPELTRMELGEQLAYTRQQLTAGTGDPQLMNQLRDDAAKIEQEIKQPSVPLGPFVVFMALWKILGFGLSAALVFIHRSFRSSNT